MPSGNQRRYERTELRRVSFIRIAQQTGICLDRIREALGEPPESRTPAKELDHRILTLQKLRDDATTWRAASAADVFRCAHSPPTPRRF